MQITSMGAISAQLNALSLISRGGGGDGDSLKHGDGSQPEIKELFEKKVNQKKNIYSTDPIPLNNPWTFWVDK